MSALALIALGGRLALSAVFVVAGVAKLADGPGTRRAVAEFTGTNALAQQIAAVLPLAELLVAALLLPATTAVAGAAGALTLLALFTVAMAVNLARGRTPNCRCFGQLHSTPVSRRMLARNVVLLTIAGIALVPGRDGSLSGVAWIGRLDSNQTVAVAAGLTAVVLVAIGSVAFVSLLRSYGLVLVRLDRLEHALAAHGLKLDESRPVPKLGLEPGTRAPEIADIDSLLAAGLPVLLFFLSPSCGPCKALLPRAAAWQVEHADVLTVAFAVDGTREAAQIEVADYELERLLHDEDHKLYNAFKVSGTPSGVLISAEGKIASWVASGSDAIEQLLRQALLRAPGLRVGTEFPDIELDVLDGRPVRLHEFRGRDTLLLFWNPSCGFCRAMREQLLAWERTASHSLRLVLISSGNVDETRAEGFTSTIVVDPKLAVGKVFGVAGTPMAVLLDRGGRLSTPLAAGGDAVFSLLSR
jgi:thiol-disulfide isomerase/thioredoxin